MHKLIFQCQLLQVFMADSCQGIRNHWELFIFAEA